MKNSLVIKCFPARLRPVVSQHSVLVAPEAVPLAPLSWMPVPDVVVVVVFAQPALPHFRPPMVLVPNLLLLLILGSSLSRPPFPTPFNCLCCWWRTHTHTHTHNHTIPDKQPTGRIRTFSTFYLAAYGGMLFLTMGKSFERRKCFIYDLGNCN